MEKKKLKKFVVPSLYGICIVMFTFSLYFIERTINNKRFKDNNDMEYVDKEIVTENEYIPVINQEITLLKPFLKDNININKSFYNEKDESTSQENSIIFYENTYMQNSGIDYVSKEKFDVVSILDGTVIEVSDNKILGKTIKIKHSNDLISTYQSLDNISVKENDSVVRGQVIAEGGVCSLYSSDINLHFELYYQGKNVNPEEFYNKNISDL